MRKFVNLRKNTETKPLMMDVSDMSVIIEHIETHTGTPKTSLSMSNPREGQFLHLDTEGWKLDTDYVVKTINEADTELFELPFIWGDGQPIGRIFVNPALVQSIIVSEQVQKDDEDEPHVALLADVIGYGRIESYKVPVSLLDEFVSKVEAHTPDMMRFESSEISTRFGDGETGFTMIDPKKVNRIYPNGYDLDINFHNGARLDFHLDRKKTVEAGRQEYLNRLVQRIQGDGTLEELFEKLDGDLNNLQPRLYKRAELLRHRLREAFANAVVAEAPHLTRIENAENVYYATLDDVSWISGNEKSLTLHFEKSAGQQYEETLTVRFDSDEKAEAELQRLMALKDTPTPKV